MCTGSQIKTNDPGISLMCFFSGGNYSIEVKSQMNKDAVEICEKAGWVVKGAMMPPHETLQSA